AESYQRAARGQTIHQTQCAFATDGVQSQMNRGTPSRLLHFIATIFAIHQDNVAALGTYFLEQLFTPNHVHGLVSERVRDLYYGAARRRIRGVLNYPIAGR